MRRRRRHLRREIKEWIDAFLFAGALIALVGYGLFTRLIGF